MYNKQAASYKRKGMTWKDLSIKYECSINTLRNSLSDYSTEFTPINRLTRSELEERLLKAEETITKITAHLKKRFNIHI